MNLHFKKCATKISLHLSKGSKNFKLQIFRIDREVKRASPRSWSVSCSLSDMNKNYKASRKLTDLLRHQGRFGCYIQSGSKVSRCGDKLRDVYFTPGWLAGVKRINKWECLPAGYDDIIASEKFFAPPSPLVDDRSRFYCFRYIFIRRAQKKKKKKNGKGEDFSLG